jgi:hypothetical protein
MTDTLELRRFCAFLLLMLGMMYVVGVLSNSATIWAVSSTVALLQLILLLAERMEVDTRHLFLFAIVFIPIATAVFLSLPRIRETIVVLCLVISNARMLLEERYS